MNKKLKLWELDRVSEEEFKGQEKFPIIVILKSIDKSFVVVVTNVEKIFLCGITATPPHRDIQKTALGATETVEWEYRESISDLVDELIDDGVQICSIEQTEQTTLLQDVKDLPN